MDEQMARAELTSTTIKSWAAWAIAGRSWPDDDGELAHAAMLRFEYLGLETRTDMHELLDREGVELGRAATRARHPVGQRAR